MVQYEIGNCIFGLTKSGNFDTAWDLFRTGKKKHTDLFATLYYGLGERYGLDIFPDQPGPAVLKCENALLSANSDWTEACITLLDDNKNGLSGAMSALVMTFLAAKEALMVHSALVETDDGMGILFIGPSGVGKTTQAELWKRYRNACIINGDMAIVKREGKQYFGYGCPWHGSSPYCENRQVPLNGIVVLEQDAKNQIYPLDGVKMVERVMRNTFFPCWNEARVELCCETLNCLLSLVPVYLLKCRPDEEAVQLLARELEHL